MNVVVRGEGAADVKFEVGSIDPPELKVTIGEPKRLKDTLVHVPVEIGCRPARGRWCGSTRRKASGPHRAAKRRTRRSRSCRSACALRSSDSSQRMYESHARRQCELRQTANQRYLHP